MLLSNKMSKQTLPLPRSLFWVLLLVFSLPSKAQLQIQPQYLAGADGVASPTVTDIIQDSYGFLWLATNKGLQRYNGLRFETFKHADGNPNSLAHNHVWGVTEDSKKNLWISTEQGISYYDRRKNEFKNFVLSESSPDMAENVPDRFYKVFIDSRQQVWAPVSYKGFFRFDAENNTWIPVKVDAPGNKHINRPDVSFAIAEDREGAIWMSSPAYGLMHCPKGGKVFKTISVAYTGGQDFSKQELQISSMYADSTGIIWINSRNGLYKYNPKTRAFKTIIEYGRTINDVWNSWDQIRQDHEGNIWVANNTKGILKFRGISDVFDTVHISGQVRIKDASFAISLTNLTIDRSGIFWLGSLNHGVLKYDPVSQSFSSYEHNAFNPVSMSPGGAFSLHASQKKPGLVYVGTRGYGLNIFDREKGTFRQFRYKAVEDFFGGSVRSILEAADGSLWIGTWGDGLIKTDENYREIKRYVFQSNSPASLSNGQVRVLKHDSDGSVWIGTDGGVNILDPQTGQFKRMVSVESNTYPKALISQVEKMKVSVPNKILIDKVTDNQDRTVTLHVSSPGRYLVMCVGEGDNTGMADFGWILSGTKDTVWKMLDYGKTRYAGGGLKNRIIIEEIDLNPGAYTVHYKTDDSHAFNQWNDSPPDETKLYGIALIKLVDEAGKPIRPLFEEQENDILLHGTSIADIEPGRKYIWVASRFNGLDRIDRATKKVRHYQNAPANNNSLSANQLADIYEDKHGILWIATSRGLDRLDPATETFIRYSEKDGLPTDLVMSILPGVNDEIWLGTQNGISQMIRNDALGKVTFINYNAADGIGGNTFIPLVATKTADGHLYFGGEHGVSAISDLKVNRIIPPIVLSNLFLSNQSVMDMGDRSPLRTSLAEVEEITLAYDQNNISFEFTALHFVNPLKNQYAHMLKGHDQDWTYDNRNFVTYTNLEPGEYEFRMRASNGHGVWNEKGRTIYITILPPWWRTWWAYTLYALLLVLFILVAVRLLQVRIKRMERERSRERLLQQGKEIEKAYTELKATQAQLVHAEKMASLGELTAGIAHEIQNPLNFINNFSEINKELLEEMQAELQENNYAEAIELAIMVAENEKKINDHGKRADGIVKGMLQHSRVSNSAVKEPTDINKLADEYLRLTYHGLRAKDKSFNATIKANLDETIKKVNIIPQDIGRVLLNLLTNAFYAVSEKSKQQIPGYEPTVTVTTAAAATGIVLTVADNGNGIPEENMDRIFHPFFTTKPTGQGTGLGLSISYDIITKGHGGELKAASSEGEGTIFSILLFNNN